MGLVQTSSKEGDRAHAQFETERLLGMSLATAALEAVRSILTGGLADRIKA